MVKGRCCYWLLLMVILTIGQSRCRTVDAIGSVRAFSDVITLTDANFAVRLADADLALVKFYGPECEECIPLASEFAGAASQLRDNAPPVILAEVDCAGDGKHVCDEHGVHSYPLMKIFKRGRPKFDYNGPAKLADIVEFLKTEVGPASRQLLTLEDADYFLDHPALSISGFFEDEASEKNAEFQKLAEKFGNRVRFGHTFSADVCAKYSYKNEIVLFRELRLRTKFEPSQVPFEGSEATLDNLEDWLKKNLNSLVGHRTMDNEENFSNPLVVAYYEVDYLKNAKGTNYWRNRIVKLAKKYSDAGRNVSFAISSSVEYKRELRDFGLTANSKSPVVAARNLATQKFRMTKEFSPENLENFVEAFLAGDMIPFKISEPIPETNDGPVKVVVAETFDEIVKDVTKDVLIEIYSPMCGQCMQLAPRYEKLAIELKDEPDLVIAKIDGTVNELPDGYGSYGMPTIYFAPKGSKDKPILYDGRGEVDLFVKFLAREATDPLKGFDREGRPNKPRKVTAKDTQHDKEPHIDL